MKLFLDTANVEEIREAASLGVISGVTTNPTLVAKEGRKLREVIREIVALVEGPVSVEAVSQEAEGMVKEALELASWAPNVVVKIPLTWEGLKAAARLRERGVKTNLTLAFSANQALLAARAGATFVSPFVGRLDDVSHEGMDVVRETAAIFSLHGLATEIIAASLRHPRHVVEAALAGAHVATVPYQVLQQMVRHPLTDLGVQRFLADWEKLLQKTSPER